MSLEDVAVVVCPQMHPQARQRNDPLGPDFRSVNRLWRDGSLFDARTTCAEDFWLGQSCVEGAGAAKSSQDRTYQGQRTASQHDGLRG